MTNSGLAPLDSRPPICKKDDTHDHRTGTQISDSQLVALLKELQFDLHRL